MFQRFKLTIHREIKELLVYSSYESGIARMNAVGISMASLANRLGRQQFSRTVTDNTGLSGAYDFKLEWAPQQTADSPGPFIFTALQEQLGLKLEERKGSVEIVVIDSAEKAPAN